MGGLDWPARTVGKSYGQCMTVEQEFHEQKNRRNGHALRNIQVTKAEHLDRLLSILAFPYVLLVGLEHERLATRVLRIGRAIPSRWAVAL